MIIKPDPEEVDAVTKSNEKLGKRRSAWVRLELAAVLNRTNNLPQKDSVEPIAEEFIGGFVTNTKVSLGATGRAGFNVKFARAPLADDAQVVWSQSGRMLSGGTLRLESGTVQSKDTNTVSTSACT